MGQKRPGALPGRDYRRILKGPWRELVGIGCHVAQGAVPRQGAEQWQGWTGCPTVTHSFVPAGRGDGGSPRGRRARAALGATSPLHGVPHRRLFSGLPQKGFGFSLAHIPPRVTERRRLLQCGLSVFSPLLSSPQLATKDKKAKPCLSFPMPVSRRGRTPVPHSAMLEQGDVSRGAWAGAAGLFPAGTCSQQHAHLTCLTETAVKLEV